jgi:hypothetical protein
VSILVQIKNPVDVRQFLNKLLMRRFFLNQIKKPENSILSYQNRLKMLQNAKMCKAAS